MSENKAPDEDVVMWLRLPEGTTVEQLNKLGVKGAACYGGDTCIAATTLDKKAGLVLQGDLKSLLSKSSLVPHEVACFGGDTCIV